MTGSSLAHLRTANPCPQPGTIDDAALFARITSLAPDPRLRRQASRHRRPVIVLTVSLATLALLSSTAFAISKWVVPLFVGPQVTQSDYLKSQHQLTLPPGYSWPALHIPADSVSSTGAGGGSAVLAAQWAWESYWVKAIRDGDSAAQRRAHGELNALLDNNVIVAPAGSSENWTPANPPKGPYAVFADDGRGGLQLIREAYAQAAAGKPQLLIQFVRGNAPN
jgi:hypothetical protein